MSETDIKTLCVVPTDAHYYKNHINVNSVHVGMDAVNVMAAYQPVVQACGEPHAC